MEDLLFPPGEVVYEYEGEQMCSEELALAQLLVDDILIPFDVRRNDEKTTTGLYVNCSDDFAWACADCEPLTKDEIASLYKMHIVDRTWGALRWVCLKRNEQPQAPRKKQMVEAGSWDTVLEALPANGYDQFCRQNYPQCPIHAEIASA